MLSSFRMCFKTRRRQTLLGVIVAGTVLVAPLLATATVFTFPRIQNRRVASILDVYRAVRDSETTLAYFMGATHIGSDTFEAPAGGVYGQLNTVNAKLDRLAHTCARSGSGTVVAVNENEVRQCVDGCLRGSLDANPGRRLDERLFISCVSRCPSADGDGASCAQRYMNFSNGFTRESTDDTIAYYTANPTRTGAQDRIREAQQLRSTIPLINGTLYACLSNGDTNDCQSNCEGLADLTQWRSCMGRCSNIVDPVQIPTSAGLLQTSATAGVPTPVEEQPVMGTAPARRVPAPAKSAADDAVTCVTACGTARITCMVAAQNAKSMDNCAAFAITCLQACPVK